MGVFLQKYTSFFSVYWLWYKKCFWNFALGKRFFSVARKYRTVFELETTASLSHDTWWFNNFFFQLVKLKWFNFLWQSSRYVIVQFLCISVGLFSLLWNYEKMCSKKFYTYLLFSVAEVQWKWDIEHAYLRPEYLWLVSKLLRSKVSNIFQWWQCFY